MSGEGKVEKNTYVHSCSYEGEEMIEVSGATEMIEWKRENGRINRKGMKVKVLE